MAAHRFLGLVKRTGGPSGGSDVHLTRHDAESSLCGIPRSSLTGGGMFDQVICSDYMEWLDKRRRESADRRKAEARADER